MPGVCALFTGGMPARHQHVVHIVSAANGALELVRGVLQLFLALEQLLSVRVWEEHAKC